MNTVPQLLHCGIKPHRRQLLAGGIGDENWRDRRPAIPSLARSGRPCARVRALVTERSTGSARTSPTSKISANSSTNGAASVTRLKSVSDEIKRVRAQMEEDEQLATLMRGLRGQNLSDSEFADENVALRLVEVHFFCFFSKIYLQLEAADSSETLPPVYDPDFISLYWRRRPRAVATRIVQLLTVAGRFLSNIALDLINKKIKENEVARAIELREIVTSLGPAYIKLGQALSIRPDILSPAAMTELQKLCDKVPSFSDDVAMALIEEELGRPWHETYSELTSSPIAAGISSSIVFLMSLASYSSLGQVYKGRLKETGDLVAVKVQRPFVLETVTIDLYIIRKVGLLLRRFPQVVIPKTYSKYTSRKVLTTQWIDGEKLSQSTESDVGELVNLLDTGFFHADPHPGNLIRTPDGKLAILDFGLVTRLTDDQKYGMVEAIAHLIHRDYDAIVKDFVKLGFIPEGVNLEPILPVLGSVFDQALEGGGAKNINFQELASDLAQITFDYPFRIPPYFALIIRAIGVLEGIALVGNPDFAIVDEAYPYIAQRLLTDESPQLRSALRYTIYGKSGVFDAERFIDVMQAFENFITAAKSGGGEGLNGNMAGLGMLQSQTGSVVQVFPIAIYQKKRPVETRAALAFLLSDKGNFFREFILDEFLGRYVCPSASFQWKLEKIVKAIDAVSREQLVRILETLGFGNVAPVFSMVPLKPAALLPTVTEEDRIILNNVEKVVKFLTAGTSKITSKQDVNIAYIIRELLPVLPGIAGKVLPEVMSRLTQRILARLIRDSFL
ncbi:putative aarF domain-containing protein kinase [Apostasia shenzhenica]|uniref:Putative aarF domain-containing protein kinase n=1 Tax=Apostasia shenzhenica TaxID=1088818 RepID=A0A2H9ZYR3_9ASPA|nr:putative aarF domain-containing protein kinase [Apostasia shenzhenica]